MQRNATQRNPNATPTQRTQFVWSKGIRNIPRRVRVRMSRRRNEDEEAEHPFFTLVQHVQVPTYKNLTTEVVHE